MSESLWVQLLSPEAAQAFLCQQNGGPQAQPYTITLFTSGLMAGLLMKALILIRPSDHLHCPHSRPKSFDCCQVQLKTDYFHCLHSVTAQSTSPVGHRSVETEPIAFSVKCAHVTVLQHQHHQAASHTSPSGPVLFYSSRSHQSMLCSPAPWWTCSLNSIRALKSSVNSNAQTLRLLATT